MSTKVRNRILVVAATTLLLGGGATASALAALSGSASGSVSVFVPAAMNEHELCVSSTSAGTTCRDVPGAPAVTLNVEFAADASVTPPDASVARCPGGAVVTLASGGGTLSGSATVTGALLSAATVPIAQTKAGEGVVVSYCDKG